MQSSTSKYGIGRHYPETATGHGCLMNPTSVSGGKKVGITLIKTGIMQLVSYLDY